MGNNPYIEALLSTAWPGCPAGDLGQPAQDPLPAMAVGLQGQRWDLTQAANPAYVSALGWHPFDLEELGRRMTFNAVVGLRLGASALYIPPGNHVIATPVLVDIAGLCRPLVLEADGATLTAIARMDMMVRLRGRNPSAWISIHGLILDGAGLACDGCDIQRLNQRTALATHIHVRGVRRDGIRLRACQAGVVRHCSATDCGRYGFLIQGCNAGRFEDCHAGSNGSDGFWVSNLTEDPVDGRQVFWDSAILEGCTSRGNGGTGVSVSATFSPAGALARGANYFVLRNLRCMYNGSDGVSVSAGTDGVVLDDLTLVPAESTPTTARALRIRTTSSCSTLHQTPLAVGRRIQLPSFTAGSPWAEPPASTPASCLAIEPYLFVDEPSP